VTFGDGVVGHFIDEALESDASRLVELADFLHDCHLFEQIVRSLAEGLLGCRRRLSSSGDGNEQTQEDSSTSMVASFARHGLHPIGKSTGGFYISSYRGESVV
jgi:hypothetical protein